MNKNEVKKLNLVYKLWLAVGVAALFSFLFFLHSALASHTDPGHCDNLTTTCSSNYSGSQILIPVSVSGNSLFPGAGTVTAGSAIHCVLTPFNLSPGGAGDCSDNFPGASFDGSIRPIVRFDAQPAPGSFIYNWEVNAAGGQVASGCRSGFGVGTSDNYCSVYLPAGGGPVTASVNFDRPSVVANIVRYGHGTVNVTYTGGANSCYGAVCYDVGSSITLTASAQTDSVFYGWTQGPCAGSFNSVCTFTIGQADVVAEAYFNPTLNVSKTGNGTVVSVYPFNGAINCGTGGSDCLEVVDGSTVPLQANPDSNWHFSGWGGNAATCGASAICNVTVNDVKNVVANFSPNLTIVKSGNGNGTVGVINNNYSCPPNCATPVTLTTGLNFGSTVRLTASLDGNSAVVLWTVDPISNTSGPYAPATCADDPSNQINCYIVLNSPTTITAQFYLPGLTVAKSGAGSGAVTSSDNRINCGSACSADYNYGSAVTLSAVQDTGSVFTGWTINGGTGSCIGTGPCTVYITSSVVTATANFYKPTVTVNISGPGAVTSSPAGINCGNGNTACSTSFNASIIDLIPAANAGSNFTGWSGGNGECDTIIGACRINAVVSDVVYTANFGNQLTLIVSKDAAGAGDGSFDIYNSGGSTVLVSCPSGCATASYAGGSGSSLRIQANPAVGSFIQPAGMFSSGGWTGCDSASGGSCTVNLAANRSVTVRFDKTTQRAVIANVHGSTGGGIVGSTSVYSTILNQSTLGSLGVAGGGISCDPTCLEYYDPNTNVTLQATADATSELIGWSGCTTLQP